MEDEAEDIAFADHLSHELNDDMTERGDLSFERDRRQSPPCGSRLIRTS